MNTPSDTPPGGISLPSIPYDGAGVHLPSWLAGHCQALMGGPRTPHTSVEDVDSWYIGYDVGTQDKGAGTI